MAASCDYCFSFGFLLFVELLASASVRLFSIALLVSEVADAGAFFLKNEVSINRQMFTYNRLLSLRSTVYQFCFVN